MSNLADLLSYGYFIFCLVLGWCAASVLDYDGILRRSTSRWGRLLLRFAVILILAEGFRVFLSYIIGPLLDSLVNQSIAGYKIF